MKIPLIPLVILFFCVVIVIKVVDRVRSVESDLDPGYQFSFDIHQAQAADEEEHNGEAPEGGDDGERHAEKISPTDTAPRCTEPSELSEVEQNILENLTNRRQDLEQWSESIAMKENLLKVTEKKISRKMNELKKLQSEVVTLLVRYEEKENKKIRQLVKIYESMKGKDAARIFDEMDLVILLDVVENMKESKAALILAKMNPKKANEITTRIVQRHRMPNR